MTSSKLNVIPSASEAPNDLSDVLKSGMCISCGACTFADTSLSLTLDPTWGLHQPNGVGSNAAASVCPAISVNYQGLQETLFPNQPIGPHGVVRSVHLAQSTNFERNLKASSGGMVKEILSELLRQDDVDGVIALKEVHGLEFEPTLLRRPEEVDSLPGSIYHNLPLHKTLALLKANEGKFVVVGIPCQLEGLYQYIFNCEPELRNRIHSTVGIICGWNYSHHSLHAIAEYKGFDYDNIESISYRGGGPVGKMRVLADNKEYRINRRVDFSYQVAFDRSFNIRRCHVCINHCNFLGDIVVGDAWLPSTIGTKTGISIVICRTAQSEALLSRLAERGAITTCEASVNEITESQSRSITFGDFAYAYQQFLRTQGEFCPELPGPNREEARPRPSEEVAAFHRNIQTKLELQRGGRYRRLWWRKATIELKPFIMRYVRWFFVRVVKVKSLLGVREELSHDQVSIFK